MRLRGNRVLARCDARGELEVVGGKVEIRYKPRDGRAYEAGARNLEADGDGAVLPDDHCGPAERPAPRKAGASGARKPKAGASGEAPPSKAEGDEVLVYADGACSGNPGPAGLGVVMLWDDERRELSEYLGRATNNIAELTAILRAAEATPDPKRPLRVYTDSSYAIGVLSKGWKAKANQELVAAVKAALARLDDVRLFYVRGHAGVPLNERADALAVEAVRSKRKGAWVEP
jgi:ribonuclease HI